jgi:hypothetical protein
MRGLVVVAYALVALAIAPAAHADVTIGSSLPPPSGGFEGCAFGCTRSLTVIAGQATTAPFHGVVTRWRIRAGGNVAPVRFVILRRRQPDYRWYEGGMIPIMFHWVLAAFLFTYASQRF